MKDQNGYIFTKIPLDILSMTLIKSKKYQRMVMFMNITTIQ